MLMEGLLMINTLVIDLEYYCSRSLIYLLISLLQRLLTQILQVGFLRQ